MGYEAFVLRFFHHSMKIQLICENDKFLSRVSITSNSVSQCLTFLFLPSQQCSRELIGSSVDFLFGTWYQLVPSVVVFECF